MKTKLSVIILTHQGIDKKTLSSASFADEIIIFHDSKRNQKTPIINNPNIKIYSHPLKNFSRQRNLALTKTKNDWCLFLDSDEIISKKLSQEIITAIQNPVYSGYYLRRHDRYYGKTLAYGEIGQTKILRLAKKTAGLWQRSVHETWKINGKTILLINPLLHNRKVLVSNFFTRFLIYCPLDATALIKEAKPFSYFRLIFNPHAKFVLNYFFRAGIIDGYLGLFHAYLMSIQSLTVRIFQWELKQSNS